MGKKITKKPKTHSDVLWHFTGGPKWNTKKNAQEKKLKPNKDAFGVAIDILSSKELRLGSYHEVIKVIIPSYRKYDIATKQIKILKNHQVELRTSPVCCVADIPETELFHHGLRYGKMGIGFKRSSILKAGFNPVFYTLHHTDIANKFFSAQRGLESVDASNIEMEVDTLLDNIRGELCTRCEDEIDLDGYSIVSEAESQIWDVEESLGDLEDIMSFVKTFDHKEFDTIYAEREWRSIESFKFNMSDIDCLVFPDNNLKNEFEKNYKKTLKLPKTVKLRLFDELFA